MLKLSLRQSVWTLTVAGALTCASAFGATVAQWTTSDTTVYAQFNGLESTGLLASDATLTNQFAPSIVFGGEARANSCGSVPSTGWSFYGMAGNNYITSLGPSCLKNSVQGTLSMSFGSDLSALAMDLFASMSPGNAFAVELRKHGAMVGSFDLTSIPYIGLAPGSAAIIGERFFENDPTTERVGILVVDGNGSLFDEIRFVESEQNAAAGNYVFFDNVRYNAAAVPEPGTLALLGLGLAGLAATRRRKQ